MDARLVPKHDRNTKSLLNLLGCLRQRRLADQQCLCRPAKMPFSRQNEEIVQMLDLKVVFNPCRP
ncbi:MULTISPECIES: hypothetical protein [unclassified Bradyrhizobium]|uniref:hypothetical protein n=1 Tax=unclassified Bradyrhizobium TaxID=2631580 RepID=UPI001FF766AD|nr:MULTISPECIES: hypothetical protein [unclassified Bradyrhizobium]